MNKVGKGAAMNHIVAVTGATGHVGGALAEMLLSRGVRVRVISRQAERAAALVRKGAEPLIADLEDAAVLSDAFSGADAAFIMIPPNYNAPDIRADQRQMATNLTKALMKSHVPRAVMLSSIGAGLADGTGPIAGLHEFEEMLKGVQGLSTLVLRAAYFMENHLHSIDLIKSADIISSAIRSEVKLPMVATRDIASTAAGFLSAPAFRGFTIREVLGPRDYTMNEATAILGAAIGKPDLQYVAASYEDLRKALLTAGFSTSAADAMVEMQEAF